jgi:hypothetical protein
LGDVRLVDRWHRGAKARSGGGWKSGCRSDKEKKHEVMGSERQVSRDERKKQRGARDWIEEGVLVAKDAVSERPIWHV